MNKQLKICLMILSCFVRDKSSCNWLCYILSSKKSLSISHNKVTMTTEPTRCTFSKICRKLAYVFGMNKLANFNIEQRYYWATSIALEDSFAPSIPFISCSDSLESRAHHQSTLFHE